MLTEALTFIEGEERDGAAPLLDESPADHSAFLVVQEPSKGLGDVEGVGRMGFLGHS
jgi:hypothetical protein